MDLSRPHPARDVTGRSIIHVVVVGVVPTGSEAGGPANATARLVGGLAEAGLRVTVVSPTRRPADQNGGHPSGVEVVHAPSDERFSLLRGMRSWRNAALAVINAAGADLVHGQGLLTGGVPAAAVSRIPRVVTVRGNSRMDTLNAYGGTGGRVRAAIRDRLAARVLGSVDVVVNVHPDWRMNLPRKPARMAYVPNIVDDAFFEVLRAPDAHTVLYCGGNRRIKGWDVLEAAWPSVLEAIPDARLEIVGWPRSAPRPKITSAAVVSALSPVELAQAMSRASLVVIPSRYEVAPILLAESWAASVPVVATSAGGMASLADAGAVVVPTESPALLALGMIGVLRGAIDVDAFVAQGRLRAELHRAREVVNAHISLYDELVVGGAA